MNGACEIGYSLVPAHHCRGYAKEPAKALLGWVFGHAEVVCVAAETLSELSASLRVMEKRGMRFVGPEEGPPTVHMSCCRRTSSYGNGDTRPEDIVEFLEYATAPAETPVWKWYAYVEILRRNSCTFEKNLLHR
jgi:hypothetical protein